MKTKQKKHTQLLYEIKYFLIPLYTVSDCHKILSKENLLKSFITFSLFLCCWLKKVQKKNNFLVQLFLYVVFSVIVCLGGMEKLEKIENSFFRQFCEILGWVDVRTESCKLNLEKSRLQSIIINGVDNNLCSSIRQFIIPFTISRVILIDEISITMEQKLC